ncbi:ABC transporter ATP-binding protein [Thiobacillus sp.]|uniref:oligopeptide/dipeptide ABC transporter ATP-binding protein n=1 Tax=Thiobacillus sp. TaxID=924 RepID=UPI00180633F1|nr:ABC transporter ATP-binding protein [Thiobacillus sp.]MBC2732057.1 ABC transporter ATP-binding protein [Thiobacillus sp.]MBC2740795.1 ABC transporter ATP-binding protein [Thiobacillus sp.]MBC2759445.1 ABC transporter ATP-binding protein [Thiobacillus sp.]
MQDPVFSLLDVERSYELRGSGWFNRSSRQLKALDGVRLELQRGDTLALVGESGSGKSTLIRLMLGLEPASDGRVLYGQRDLAQLDAAERKRFAREVAFIYQNARGSMNPRMRIADILAEPIRLHGLCAEHEIAARVAALLDRVGLPAGLLQRFPGELSGGQVRRVAIARALAAEPEVIMADESVAGLDVSVQAQVLNLLRDLCRESGITLVFITHDLGVASYLCDKIAVLYLGRIVEQGPTDAILNTPRHPYTRALLQAFPRFDVPLKASLSGEIPSPVNLPQGCRFAGRCPQVQAACRATDPSLTALEADRQVACLFPVTAA